MFAVIFEVEPRTEGKAEYLKIASELRKYLENQDGFISIDWKPCGEIKWR